MLLILQMLRTCRSRDLMRDEKRLCVPFLQFLLPFHAILNAKDSGYRYDLIGLESS